MKEFNFDGKDIKVYADAEVEDDTAKIDNIEFIVTICDLHIDVTDVVMYRLNKNPKHKKQMVDMMKEEAINNHD